MSDVAFLMQVNTSPYEKGWIIKVEVSDTGELKKWMEAEEYYKLCEELKILRATRIRRERTL
jgi:hypothetical protein